jgi:hypothetical protein
VAGSKLLLLAFGLGIMLALAAPTVAVASPPTCSPSDLLVGTCNISGQINDGGVTLSGHKNTPGSSGGKLSGKGKPAPAPKTCPEGALPETCQLISIIPPGQPGNPAVTINDLKNFKPVPGTDHMQPNGWIYVSRIIDP